MVIIVGGLILRKKRVVGVTGIICVLLIISRFCCGSYNQMKSVNGNNEDGIRKSIAYLHKDHINKLDEIKIIDEFNYENKKVILFKYSELTGIAKFNKDESGKYEIVFVETLGLGNKRKISKAS